MALIVYTCSPEALDFKSTTTLETFQHSERDGGQTRQWRKVSILGDERLQCHVYRRGRHDPGPTLDDPREVLLFDRRSAPDMASLPQSIRESAAFKVMFSIRVRMPAPCGLCGKVVPKDATARWFMGDGQLKDAIICNTCAKD